LESSYWGWQEGIGERGKKKKSESEKEEKRSQNEQKKEGPTMK